jgi:hypothetical protein
MNAWRNGCCAALLVTLVALVAAGVAAGASAARIEGPFGRGASQVWLLVPKGRVRSIVVFGHGWKSSPPMPASSWIEQFRPWLDHLVANGSVVVFPRYQIGRDDSIGSARAVAYRRGLETAFAHLPGKGTPVVAAGYSFGGSLAFSYAANARRWRLPRPAAVDAVFPAGPIAGAPLPVLGRTVRVLIQVGDRDQEAGSAGAAAFWAWLKSHPRTRKRYDVLASTPGLSMTHSAPKRADRAARRAFWRPLDMLIGWARRARPSR